MLKILSKIILKLTGWKLRTVTPKENKFILIGAPHTSNWDFPLALLTFWTLDFNIHWVAKVQMFRGPLKHLFTTLGGIPVDRSASHGFIQQIADRFNQTEQMVLTIAPEGTRSKTEYWKSGFYHIALAANVPICLGYINYKKRELGFHKLMHPSGDIDADMKIIADFYNGITGKRPQLQGPVVIRKQ
ncbi:Acyltransferase family protein [hydrothermal vent metagenome]|uniref:Acyltransferase family protein n=1 Tax=hydrothermal vent metagenome TaxID=652676 RepID=A0A3B0WDP0_9ZZZZ